VRGVEPIGRILEGVIEELGFASKLSEQRAVIEWSEIVGPKVAAHSRALRVDHGRLVVEVRSSVWAQELSLMSRGIVAKMNDRLGKRTVENLQFVVGGKTTNDPFGRNGHEDKRYGR